jgi:hypothetical protein
MNLSKRYRVPPVSVEPKILLENWAFFQVGGDFVLFGDHKGTWRKSSKAVRIEGREVTTVSGRHYTLIGDGGLRDCYYAMIGALIPTPLAKVAATLQESQDEH